MLHKEIDIKYWYLPLAVVVVGMALSYGSTITTLVNQWLNNDDFSHGLLIMPISLYLIWEKRGQLAAVPVRTDWRALPLLLLAVCIFIVGELGAELFTTRVSIIMLLISSIWMLYGYEVIKVIRFPLLFLFMMLPLPGFIYRNITFPLQLISSTWSVAILHLLGISAYREGNVIDMGFTQFQVVEACNGLRFILPLLTLGVLFAFWWSKESSLWKRMVLIAASVPIAILANVARIAGTGIVSMVWSVEAAEGFFHGFSGWAVFMLCFGLYALLNFGLKFLPGGKPRTQMESTGKSEWTGAPRRYNLIWGPVAVIAIILLVSPLAVSHLGSVPPRHLQQPLDAFPLHYQSWIGKSIQMDESIWNSVGGQDYIEVNYLKDGAQPVNFYTAYYEYQRKAGDFVHVPKVCLQ